MKSEDKFCVENIEEDDIFQVSGDSRISVILCEM